MKNTKKIPTFLASAVLIVGAISADAATYIRGNDADPETLDQHKTSLVSEGHLLRDLYEGLVASGPDGNTMPGSAERWDVSQDGLVYTFYLRKNAKWSNGEPLVAQDFVYAFNRIMDPATAAKYVAILYPIKNAEKINTGQEAELGVRALDTHILEITLEQPTPYLIELLTQQMTYPLYAPSVEKYGNDFIKPGNLVTNGAYFLESFAPNDKIILKKNPHFYDADNVSIDTVHFIPFEDRANCARRFEAGEIHSCSDIATEQLGDLQKRLGDQVRIAPYLGTYYYSLNTKNPKLADTRVRQALSISIDRDFLSKEILQSAMAPAYTLVPPGIQNYVTTPPHPSFQTMPMLDREDAAKTLLQDAGYGLDNPLVLEISYNTSENHKNVATAVADMWASIGIKTTFNIRDSAAHYAMLRDERNHEVARASWIADFGDPQNFLFLNQTNNPGFNYGNYSNPDYDALMAKAEKIVDLTERANVLAEAEQLILNDIPQIPLLYFASLSLVSPKLEGWIDNAYNYHSSRFLKITE